MNSSEIPSNLPGLELSDSSKKTDGSKNHCPLVLPEPIVSSSSVDDPEASLTPSFPGINQSDLSDNYQTTEISDKSDTVFMCEVLVMIQESERLYVTRCQ